MVLPEVHYQFKETDQTITQYHMCKLWVNIIVGEINLPIIMCQYMTKFLDYKTKANVYYSFIYPHLIYGIY